MTESTTEAWPEPPLAGTEAAAILGALERQRATLAWKCSGLDASGLRAISSQYPGVELWRISLETS
jgi:hypothetical protein